MHINTGLRGDPNAVADETEAAIPASPRACHQLALARVVQIDDREVDDGAEICVAVEHFYVVVRGIGGHGLRRNPDKLGVTGCRAHKADATVEIGYCARFMRGS